MAMSQNSSEGGGVRDKAKVNQRRRSLGKNKWWKGMKNLSRKADRERKAEIYI